MARLDFSELSTGTIGASFQPSADVLFQMGILHASGRDGAVDLVSAHMYFNLADRNGAEDAAYHRQEIAAQLSKADLAKALRAAREWLTFH
ncbi:MAG: sel1 repeat family protein [Rhizobiaceae bacterium]|nr:sel1 repeat family protein [Rhizobiaceae bacterium]